MRTWLRNLPLRRAFSLYILLYLLAGAAVCFALLAALGNTMNGLYAAYATLYFEQPPVDGRVYLSLSDVAAYQVTLEGTMLQIVPLSPHDRVCVGVVRALQTLSIPACLLSSVAACSLSFYKRRLRAPLALLRDASQRIAQNDLDFHVAYDRADELGRLCAAFERMRAALEQNERAAWRAAEERRRLDAALAHDLRTPLTVLRGQTDLLRAHLPGGRMPVDKALAALEVMDAHTARLERYVDGMNQLLRLEDIAPQPRSISCGALCSALRGSAQALCGERVALAFETEDADAPLCVDADIAARALDNLLSNALRFARSTVRIQCGASSGALRLTVWDDGPGFPARLLDGELRPFGNGAQGAHFGLGLYICRVLCERHGGQLTLDNPAQGGARATALLCPVSDGLSSDDQKKS